MSAGWPAPLTPRPQRLTRARSGDRKGPPGIGGYEQALAALADKRKYKQDYGRGLLAQLAQRYPDTEAGRMAQLRVNQDAGTGK